MSNILPIGYETQVGNIPNNDCGASIVGIAKAYKVVPQTMTVQDVYYQILPNGTRGLTLIEIQNWLTGKGITNSVKVVDAPTELYELLQQKRPAFFLIHYGTWVDKGLTQFTNFRGGHYVTAMGIDLDNVIVHDPDHSDGKGTAQPIPMDVFFQSLKDCQLDYNPQYVSIIPDLSIRDLSGNVVWYRVNHVLIPNAINIRSGPSDTAPIIGYLNVGVKVQLMFYDPKSWCAIAPGKYVWGPFMELAV